MRALCLSVTKPGGFPSNMWIGRWSRHWAGQARVGIMRDGGPPLLHRPADRGLATERPRPREAVMTKSTRAFAHNSSSAVMRFIHVAPECHAHSYRGRE
jgi:hypothetical protein